MLLSRDRLASAVRRALARSPGVVLVGPRQAGKSTLARSILPRESPNYFDLEYPAHVQRLSQPAQVLERLEGLVVIDEVQRMPGLFPLLRVLMDRSDRPGQYLLLGSASPNLARQAGESLLGRVETIEVGGFDLEEVAAQGKWDDGRADQLWLRGGFPPSWLAASDDSFAWRQGAIAMHVQNDLPQFGLDVAAPAMLRFWAMLAHCHGQVWSAADPARSLGVSEPTIRRYLDILTQTMMVRQLQPWHENLGKRQVKAPKIYFRDCGLLHAMLDVRTLPQLLVHPRSGASWEGFALEQVLRLARPDHAWFWATHQGAELDLLMFRGERRIGVEFKRSDAPRMTPSMRIARDDLRLDALYVVYPGRHRYALADGVEAVPLWAVLPGRSS
ncbi:ATP-binding protein [Ramlibacter sp. AN1133]|uniref:ATP-binding protein n=1 Tax=Ramlibacter sp. AN1133 TaxID=3133429 RepID=UPI0030C0581A